MNLIPSNQLGQILRLHDDIDSLISQIDQTSVYRLRFQEQHDSLAQGFTLIKPSGIQDHIHSLVALKTSLYHCVPGIEHLEEQKKSEGPIEDFDIDYNF